MKSINYINEAADQFRLVAGPNEFYDILEGMKPGQFMTFGYVTAANVDYPKMSIKNPSTNRMNKVNDFKTFGHNMGFEDVPTGVVKLTIYNVSWQDKKKLSSKYGDFKNTRDSLQLKYGLGVKSARYNTQNNNFGSGVKQYDGNNDELKQHTYTDLNMAGIKPKSTTYYVTFENGSILPVEKTQLPLSPKKAVMSTIDKLMAAGATEEEIAPLRNMDYRRFEHSKVLFISCTSDGIPTLFINTKLSDTIGGITNVNPNALINVAKERYSKFTTVQESIQRNNMRNKIRINEATFKRIIAESVKKVLKEHFLGQESDYFDDETNDTSSKKTWRGVPGSKFIWQNQNDSIVIYNGQRFNGNGLDDIMWGIYSDDCEAQGLEPSEDEFENLSPEWFKYHLEIMLMLKFKNLL